MTPFYNNKIVINWLCGCVGPFFSDPHFLIVSWTIQEAQERPESHVGLSLVLNGFSNRTKDGRIIALK